MQAKPLAFFFASFLLLCFYWASFLKTEHSLFNAGLNAKRDCPPWGLVILLQSILTYIYSVLYTLRMELQGDTSKFWQKIFKVLSSRFDMVIYVFFPVFYQLQVFALSTKIWRYVVNLLQHICHRISKNHPKYGRS